MLLKVSAVIVPPTDGVYRYQTLLTGLLLPQVSTGSVASVVAPVVSTELANGVLLIAVAFEKLSLPVVEGAIVKLIVKSSELAFPVASWHRT